MANSEHIDILRKGVDAWNQWRKDNPSVKPDLSEADFTTNIACDADPEKLMNYHIGGSRIYTHDLPEMARMVEVLVTGHKLYKFYYRIQFWYRGIFRKGRTKPSLLESNPPSIKYSTYLRGIDLSHSNLDNANLEAVYLPEANLEATSCVNTNFHNADLRQATLSNARLSNACLSNADLEGAQLKGSNPYKASFQRAILRLSITHMLRCSTTSH